MCIICMDLNLQCRSVASVPLMYVWNNKVSLENPESSRTQQVKRKADAVTPKGKKPKVKGPPVQQKSNIANTRMLQGKRKVNVERRPKLNERPFQHKNNSAKGEGMSKTEKFKKLEFVKKFK